MRRLGLAFSFIFLITVVFGFYFVSQFNQDFTSPGPLEKPKTINIPSGSGLNQISDIFKKEQIIADDFLFVWSVRLRGKGRELKAGEYEFAAHLSPFEAMQVLIDGKTFQHKFTAAEGLTTEEILKDISAFAPLSGDIAIPPQEGELLPETYLFARGYKRQDLVNRMRQGLAETLDNLWVNRDFNSPFKTKHEALVMASIVEKETALPKERPLIASVFLNRLKMGMPLQSDPTISYALHKDQDRPLNQGLSRKDLKYSSPYNTYLIRGLPPKPICNPGKDSLVAVFKPEASKALYFVADGTGGHIFSTTLKEHQRNHAKWRKIRRKLKKAQAQGE